MGMVKSTTVWMRCIFEVVNDDEKEEKEGHEDVAVVEAVVMAACLTVFNAIA